MTKNEVVFCSRGRVKVNPDVRLVKDGHQSRNETSTGRNTSDAKRSSEAIIERKDMRNAATESYIRNTATNKLSKLARTVFDAF